MVVANTDRTGRARDYLHFRDIERWYSKYKYTRRALRLTDANLWGIYQRPRERRDCRDRQTLNVTDVKRHTLRAASPSSLLLDVLHPPSGLTQPLPLPGEPPLATPCDNMRYLWCPYLLHFLLSTVVLLLHVLIGALLSSLFTMTVPTRTWRTLGDWLNENNPGMYACSCVSP